MSVQTNPPTNSRQGSCGLKLKIKFSSSKGFVSDFVDEVTPQTVPSEPACIASGQELQTSAEKTQSDTLVPHSAHVLSRHKPEQSAVVHQPRMSSPHIAESSCGLETARRRSTPYSADVWHTTTPPSSQIPDFHQLLGEYREGRGKNLAKKSAESVSYSAADSRSSSDNCEGVQRPQRLSSSQHDELDGTDSSAADNHKQWNDAAGSAVCSKMAVADKEVDLSSPEGELVKGNVMHNQVLANKEHGVHCSSRQPGEMELFSNSIEKSTNRLSVKFPKENPLFPWSVGDSAVPEVRGEQSLWYDTQREQSFQEQSEQSQSDAHCPDLVPTVNTLPHVDGNQSPEACVPGEKSSPIKRVILVDYRNPGGAGAVSEINNNRDLPALGDSSFTSHPRQHEIGSLSQSTVTSDIKYPTPPGDVSSDMEKSPSRRWRLSLLPSKNDSSAGSDFSTQSCDQNTVQVNPRTEAAVTGTTKPLQTQDNCPRQTGDKLLRKLLSNKDKAPSTVQEKGPCTKTISLISGNVTASHVNDHRSAEQAFKDCPQTAVSSAELTSLQLNRTISELKKRVEKDMQNRTLQLSHKYASPPQGCDVQTQDTSMHFTHNDSTETTSTGADDPGSAKSTQQSSLGKGWCRCATPEPYTIEELRNHLGKIVDRLEACRACMRKLSKFWRRSRVGTQCNRAHEEDERSIPSGRWCRCENPDAYTIQEILNPKTNRLTQIQACKLCKRKLGKGWKMSREISAGRASDGSRTGGRWCKCLEPDPDLTDNGVKCSGGTCQKCMKRLSQFWMRKNVLRWCDCRTPSFQTPAAAEPYNICDKCGRCIRGDKTEQGIWSHAVSQSGAETLPQPTEPSLVKLDHNYSRSPFLVQAALRMMLGSKGSAEESVSPQITLSQSDQSLQSFLQTSVPDLEGNRPQSNMFSPQLSADLCKNFEQGGGLGHGQAGPECVPGISPGALWSHQLGCEADPSSDNSLGSTLSSPSTCLSENSADSGMFPGTDEIFEANSSSTPADQLQVGSEGTVHPCYVVMEKLGHDLLDGKALNRHTQSPCTLSCRQQSLRLLCELGKLQFCEHSMKSIHMLKEQNRKRMAVWNRKRDCMRENRTVGGYNHDKQKGNGHRNLLLQEEINCTEMPTSPAAPGFLPLSSFSSSGVISMRITQGGISVYDNSAGFGHRDCSLTAASLSDIPPAARSAVSLPVPSRSEPCSVGSYNCVNPGAAHLAQSTAKYSCSDKGKMSDENELDSCQDTSPEDKFSQPVADNDNWIKVSKFNVKYYVFQCDSRAFVVPLIKTTRGEHAVRRLDEEDLTYVKLVINQLLTETDSCARHLKFPDCLEHKGSRRNDQCTITDREAKKKAFVAPTLGAESLDIDGLKSLISDRDFSRLVPKNSRVSKSRYLQEIGEKVHMYLTGGQEETPEWIKDVAKSIVAKHKSRVKNKKRLKPSKDICIEIDYAHEEELVDVGEDGVDQGSDRPSAACDTSAAFEDLSVYEGVDQTDIFSQELSQQETHVFQQTGSYVCEEAFSHEEKKPLLGELMSIGHVSSQSSAEGTSAEPGQRIMVPLPDNYEHEDGSRVLVPPDQQPSADIPGHAHDPQINREPPERKPLLGELLLETTANEYSAQDSGQQNPPEQPQWPLVHVKAEPVDEDYSHAWQDQAQHYGATGDLSNQQTPEMQAVLYISNSTFGTGAVLLDDEPGCAAMDADADSQTYGDHSGGVQSLPCEGNDEEFGAPLRTCVASTDLAAGDRLEKSRVCTASTAEDGSSVSVQADIEESHTQILPQIVSVTSGEAASLDMETEVDGEVWGTVQAFANSEEATEDGDNQVSDLGLRKGGQHTDHSGKEQEESETRCVSWPHISCVTSGEAAQVWEVETGSKEQGLPSDSGAPSVQVPSEVPVICSVVCGKDASHFDKEMSPQFAHSFEHSGEFELTTGQGDDEDFAEDFVDDESLDEQLHEGGSKHVETDGSGKQLPFLSPEENHALTQTISKPSYTLPSVQIGVDLSIVKQEPQGVSDPLQQPLILEHAEYSGAEVASVHSNMSGTSASSAPAVDVDLGSSELSETLTFTDGKVSLPTSDMQGPVEALILQTSDSFSPDTGPDNQVINAQDSCLSPAILDVRSLASMVNQQGDVNPASPGTPESPQEPKGTLPVKSDTSKSECAPKHEQLCGSRKRKWKQPVRMQVSKATKAQEEAGNLSVTANTSCASSLHTSGMTCVVEIRHADGASGITDSVSACGDTSSDIRCKVLGSSVQEKKDFVTSKDFSLSSRNVCANQQTKQSTECSHTKKVFAKTSDASLPSAKLVTQSEESSTAETDSGCKVSLSGCMWQRKSAAGSAGQISASSATDSLPHEVSASSPSPSNLESTRSHVDNSESDPSCLDHLPGCADTTSKHPLEIISTSSSEVHPASQAKSDNLEESAHSTSVHMIKSKLKRKGKKRKRVSSKSKKKSSGSSSCVSHEALTGGQRARQEISLNRDADQWSLPPEERNIGDILSTTRRFSCTTKGLSIKIQLTTDPGTNEPTAVPMSEQAGICVDQTGPVSRADVPRDPGDVDSKMEKDDGSPASDPENDEVLCIPSQTLHSETEFLKLEKDKTVKSKESGKGDHISEQNITQKYHQIKPCFIRLPKKLPRVSMQSLSCSKAKVEKDSDSFCVEMKVGKTEQPIVEESRTIVKHRRKLDHVSREETSCEESKVRKTDRSIFSELSAVFGQMSAPSPSSRPSSFTVPKNEPPSSRNLALETAKHSNGTAKEGKLPCVAEGFKEGLFSRLRGSLVSLKDGLGVKSGGVGSRTTGEKDRTSGEKECGTSREKDSDLVVSENARERSFFDCLPQGLMDAWK